MSKTRLAKFGNDNCIFKTAGGSNTQKSLKQRNSFATTGHAGLVSFNFKQKVR